ncbi:MAG: thioredoxin family protein [Muribaculaceae bacterium]|nr:thioredoxin family protein [Muribaculaceae bacterium]
MEYNDLINSAPVVLVEFYASWCPHCQKMMPIVEDIKALLADNLKVVQLDIDENQELADNANVKSIPTFLLYDGGKLVMRESGEMTAETLLRKIQEAVS